MFTNTIKVNSINATSKQEEDVLADEEPLEIRLGYLDEQGERLHQSIANIMRSPGQDIELCLGYLFSQNIIQSSDQIIELDDNRENLIRIELTTELHPDIESLKGKTSLQALNQAGIETNANKQFQIRAEYLASLEKNLRIKQDLFHSTGGTYACGLFDNVGVVLEVAEDIGRHNAMDKLIGALLRKRALPLHKHGLIISGRASSELMQKALLTQCPLIVAIGPPSSLAVELAQTFNVSLAGFLNDGAFNIYHDDERIII